MTELPEGWLETTVGQIASDVTYGFTAPADREAVGPHMLRITDIQDNNVDWASVPYCRIPDGQKPHYLLKPEDILFARTGATVGKSFRIAGEIPESVFASYLIRVRCNVEDLSRYLAYYFQSPGYWDQVTASSAGTGQPNVNGTKLKELTFPLAPARQRQAIADKLDSLMSKINECRARLDQVPQILKKFREAVLEAAVSGRLTEEWRATQAAPVTARAYPNAERPDGAEELPASWNWHAIGDLSVRVSDGVHKKPEYVSTGVPFITVKDLTAGPGIDFSNTRFVSQADHDEFIRRTHPEKGDLLVSKDGTLGVVRLIETDRPFSIFVSVALIKLKDKSLAQYMRVALEAPLVQKQMVGVGSGLQHIHLQDLRKDVIPLPPGHEQREIVRRVTQLLALADDLLARYEKANGQVETITPSVLAKAFRGELVPQDPNDEPAEVMLERIRQLSGSADVVTKSQVKSVGARSKRQASQGGRRSCASSA